MNREEELIHNFYTAFQRGDYRTMQRCYADEAVFNDAVFTNLQAAEVRAMWQMLLESSSDLQMRFSGIEASENEGSATWIANYTFSKTGRKVENRIQAHFKFSNGKISEHTDHFSFSRWARQSLGPIGWILGKTSFLRNKVRREARRKLDAYLRKKSTNES
ncbi:ketosteroid isomerase [Pedobacter yulinensis]|uniref:Ketosteroid isomerase n=1 Tax=Pedobacter yulinensis TaxID=2126353 RepID=A0A2T3HR28_9SPHI|nr:nuclear transport factor 2 family protein [Pedobacter yulinensis]PST84851.1 ketosteroid isomerase [Pedobacter yulinensis]